MAERKRMANPSMKHAWERSKGTPRLIKKCIAVTSVFPIPFTVLQAILTA